MKLVGASLPPGGGPEGVAREERLDASGKVGPGRLEQEVKVVAQDDEAEQVLPGADDRAFVVE
jgi:hypothetical protein